MHADIATKDHCQIDCLKNMCTEIILYAVNSHSGFEVADAGQRLPLPLVQSVSRLALKMFEEPTKVKQTSGMTMKSSNGPIGYEFFF